MANGNYGQEITTNEWQLNAQNFAKLLLLGFLIGLSLGFIWFFLRSPQGYFGAVNLYFYSWLYCKIPFGCSENAIYNLRSLQPTIESLKVTFATCQTITALGTIGSVFALNNYFRQRGEELEKDKVIRGSKLLTPGELKEEIEEKYPPSPFDLIVGREGIKIPQDLAFRHISMAGASGTGKTQAINSLLRQLQKQEKQKVLIIDANGQYYSRFGKPGDKILSLYDQRAEAWDFWSEDASPEFFAEALIEKGKDGKFFSSAGRALLTDLIGLNDVIQELWSDLISSPKEIFPKLKGGISPGLLGAPEQAAGVIATASLELNFLRHLNHWNQNGEKFSITDWATNQEDCSWVYLIFRDRDLSAIKPLLRLWFDLATLGVLQRDENLDYPHLWLIADELAGLGKLPSLGKLLSQGRKYKSTVITGYQAAAQIRDIYGKDGAGEIFQGFQNKLIFRCADSETAKQSSSDLGDQDVIEIAKNLQFGRLVESDRNSLNQNLKTKPAVSSAEIQNLPDLSCYLKICHHHPAIANFDYHRYEAINQATNCEVPIFSSPRQPNQEDLDDCEFDFNPDLIAEDNDKQFDYNSELTNNNKVDKSESNFDLDFEDFLNL